MRSKKSSTESGEGETASRLLDAIRTLNGRAAGSTAGIRIDFWVGTALAGVAAAIRIPGIGRWGFTTDEFYLSQSVSNIIERGLPQFPDGGYYVRGIALQYLTALPALVLDEREIAIRLIPLVFGILTVPVFYILCRKHLPVSYAVPCALLLLFSSWHIEFSRFGRFYTPFQFVFLAFVFAFIQGFRDGVGKYRTLAWGLALFAPFVFEGSIFLPFIFLLALLWKEGQVAGRGTRMIGAVSILLAVNFLVNGVGYRSLGLVHPLPPDFASKPADLLASLPVVLPDTALLGEITSSVPAVVGYAALLLGALFVISRRECLGKDGWSVFAHTLVVVLPLLHLYALLSLLLPILVASREGIAADGRKSARFWIPYLVLTVVYWMALIVATGHGSKFLHFLVGYPPLRVAVVNPFWAAAPIWSLCLLGVIAASTIRNLNHRDEVSGPILSIVLLCLLLMPVFRTPYHMTRYMFFLFPLALLLASLETYAFAGWIERRTSRPALRKAAGALAILPVALFLGTEDFQIEQIRDVSSVEINFRLNAYAPFELHWQERFEHKGPAYYVNKACKDGDRILIDNITFAFYLEKPYTFFSPRTTPWYAAYARDFGRKEVWTSHPMVDDLDEIVELVPAEPERSLWLISQEKVGGRTVQELASKNGLGYSLKYVALDRRYKVWELRKIDGSVAGNVPSSRQELR